MKSFIRDLLGMVGKVMKKPKSIFRFIFEFDKGEERRNEGVKSTTHKL